MIELKKQYVEPDKGNVNNYMLDTSAYNYIVRNIGILEILKQSVSYGFCYYSTAIQDRELSGEGAKTYNNECFPVRMKSMDSELTKNFELVDKKLNVKLVSEVASCMRNHARLDGTNRFVSSESLEGTILEKILSKNKKESSRPFAYSHDAIIAEASVHYGCVLVSNDAELRNMVNSGSLNGAITVDELLEKANKCINGCG